MAFFPCWTVSFTESLSFQAVTSFLIVDPIARALLVSLVIPLFALFGVITGVSGFFKVDVVSLSSSSLPFTLF